MSHFLDVLKDIITVLSPVALAYFAFRIEQAKLQRKDIHDKVEEVKEIVKTNGKNHHGK